MHSKCRSYQEIKTKGPSNSHWASSTLSEFANLGVDVTVFILKITRFSEPMVTQSCSCPVTLTWKQDSFTVYVKVPIFRTDIVGLSSSSQDKEQRTVTTATLTMGQKWLSEMPAIYRAHSYLSITGWV